jgi:hypothetical protein
MLALVLPQGATLISKTLQVSNQGTGVWGPFSGGQFPNLFPSEVWDQEKANVALKGADGFEIRGWWINNRDENLARFLEANFTWEGTGSETVETSVENKHGNSPPYGEAVSIAFSVPEGTLPVPITETYAQNSPKEPFSTSIPAELLISHGVPLGFPNGYHALSPTLGVTNGAGISHRFVRLTKPE